MDIEEKVELNEITDVLLVELLRLGWLLLEIVCFFFMLVTAVNVVKNKILEPVFCNHILPIEYQSPRQVSQMISLFLH